MIPTDVNDWIRKIETGNYSFQDILEQFGEISKYLTKEELIQIKKRLEKSIK